MLVRLLLTAVLVAGFASAQGGRGGGGGGGGGDEGGMGGGGGASGAGGGMGGGMPQVRHQTKAEMLFDKLKLSNQQKEEAIPILSAAMEKAVPVRNNLDRGRKMIANLMLSKGSEEDLKKMWGDFTTVSAQMTSIEAEAFGKIYALLKPNQQSKAPQAFEIMSGMFAQMPGGGMGGRGRGGQARGSEGRQ